MTTARALLCVAAFTLVTGCLKRVDDGPPTSGPPRAYPLVPGTAERESSQIEDRRGDVLVDTPELDRRPRIVAVGETPVMQLNGARARLYGNTDRTEGFSVDNFLLLEILDAEGKVLNRASVGFAQGVLIDNDRVDNVGRMAFQFDPGEVDLTSRLPDDKPFRVRATALDSGGVGRVSDVFLVLEYPERGAGDDLRD